MTTNPHIISRTELPVDEAKWITLKKLKWIDANGKERTWECAERTTRKSSGIDAVAILAVIRSKTNAFPLSTVIIEQYRPPIDKFVVELPAGLIDEGETPEQAAIRELKEETGYDADEILEVSPVVVNDPGMTNANMKLVTASVTLSDKLEEPLQNLDDGEFIVRRVVDLATLEKKLQEYSERGFAIDARLSHFAIGYQTAWKIVNGTAF